ncbi:MULTISPECIES: hypothetical protein, partial [unclassified Phaeobacter]|uniref:hypothetical protein n=1 Tax=unclassified Phaeobacter TaxID=2621772 RepID=UPI003A89E5F3
MSGGCHDLTEPAIGQEQVIDGIVPRSGHPSTVKCCDLLECPQCGLRPQHSGAVVNGRYGPKLPSSFTAYCYSKATFQEFQICLTSAPMGQFR